MKRARLCGCGDFLKSQDDEFQKGDKVAHTSSNENRGQNVLPGQMIYEEDEGGEFGTFVPGMRYRKKVGRNTRYFLEKRGWKRGLDRTFKHAPRQWARHKRGVGPIPCRRVTIPRPQQDEEE